MKNKLFRKLFFIILLGLACLSGGSVYGYSQNNKYGIHLAVPNLDDFPLVAEMVNGNGGDWGYVTLVIQENDRDQNKWQEVFDRLRELHLIPIIRLATTPQGENWRRPKKEEASEWAKFLNSLNWVVKNRYVVLFNEPNHGREWGGEADPKDYAEVAFSFALSLKETNSNFFVMLAGFDASSPQKPPRYWDQALFLEQVHKQKPEIFDLIDGWASHSYPNPNFSGSPWVWGRGTVRTYVWELEFLKELGIKKDLPVFITETGWERNILGEETVSKYLQIAFDQVWLPDSRVWAVTPFVFDYQEAPFLGFSFKKPKSSEFFSQYHVIKNQPKIAGLPIQEEKGEIVFKLPEKLVSGSSYNFNLSLKNLGQAIWDDNYSLRLITAADQNQEEMPALIEGVFSPIPKLKPFEETEVNIFLKVGKVLSPKEEKLTLAVTLEKAVDKKQTVFQSSKISLTVIPPPRLVFEVTTFPRLFSQNHSRYEIQIFDEKENLVFRKKPVRVANKIGVVDEVENVILGKKYRVVILRDYYLPRQTFLVFREKDNQLKFKTMLPLDYNLDGKFGWQDLIRIFVK